MAIYYSKEKVAEIVEEFGKKASNTGDPAVQVALLTHRIKSLSDHLQTNHKDHSCRRSLLSMVGKRKSLLKYLHDKNLDQYREVTQKLGLRK